MKPPKSEPRIMIAAKANSVELLHMKYSLINFASPDAVQYRTTIMLEKLYYHRTTGMTAASHRLL